tara:strand:+ start:125 stop:322 length:198 start_codon:yes stop_codon:yes gene_type:complete
MSSCPYKQTGGRRKTRSRRTMRKGKKSMRKTKRVKHRRTKRKQKGGEKITIDTKQVEALMSKVLK